MNLFISQEGYAILAIGLDIEAMLMKLLSRKLIAAVFLLHVGANVHSNTPHEQGVQAIETGDLDQFMSLMNTGLKVDRPIDMKGTFLQLSIIEEQVAIARYLITQDVDVNAMNEQEHRSPLHIATEIGNSELVELLLSNKANPNIQDRRGRTPLFVTVAPAELVGFDTVVIDYSDTRKLLIAHGADVNVRDLEGWTSLLLASVEQNTEAIADLKSNGAVHDQVAAKTIAEKGKCAICHSNLAKPGIAREVHIPHLTAQHAAYIAKQLKDFRDGHRKASLMTESASYLSDELIEELSRFYEDQPRVIKKSQVSQDLPKRGKELYNKTCSQCHGTDGVATISQLTPVLAGQNPVYITNQLNNYKDSKRANDPDKVMRQISKALTEEQIEQVADYIQSL